MSTLDILTARNLEKRYGGRPVLRGLSLNIARGEIVGLLGPNGAGKTTAFDLIMGFSRPDSGQVFLKDQDVTHLPVHQRAQLGMGYLAQEPSVFGELTVEENLIAILETLPLTQQQRQQRLAKLLEELNLTPLARRRASLLSGGERRRLEITRALITQPAILLLDEPFANIDPLAVQEVKTLMRLLAQRGISILITDHNAREIFSCVDRAYLVIDGRILVSGPLETWRQSDVARHLYLGDQF
jgi:lipopolysaccharide export system ATP-binding protein